MSAQHRSQGLDLVRAAAVLAVAVSHYLGIWHPGVAAGLAAFLGGAGVQAFFALSGFLIGGILLDVAEAPTAGAWWRFMCRRWGRTLPCYYAVFVVLLALAPPEHDILGHAVAYGTMTQNLVQDPPSHWYGSTWSLTIEEAFYLLFSMALLIARRFLGRWTTWPCILAFLLFPLAARIALAVAGMGVDTHSALPHLDGIAAGVAMAALWRSHGALLARLWPLAASAGLTLLWVAWGDYLTPGATPLWMPWTPWLGCLGFALLLVPAMLVTNLAIVRRPVQAVALYSYGLYLTHGELLAGMRTLWGLPTTLTEELGMAALWLTLTVISVRLLHRYVEVPGMRLRPSQEPARALPQAAAALAA